MSPTDDQRHRLFLVPGGDKRLSRGHPWVYSNEIRIGSEEKAIAPGTVVALHRVDGKPLAAGTFNPHALIAFRRYSRNAEAKFDKRLFLERLRPALALRERLFDTPFYRLIHAEGDGLPGIVVDRFGDTLAIQASTAGAEILLPHLVAALEEIIEPRVIVLRNDVPARAQEGLADDVRVLKGDLNAPIRLRENGLDFVADLVGGQKTGWFFDQRNNRAAVAKLAKGSRVLDVYSYTGGFGITAAAAGATQVLCVDSSADALTLARESAALNGIGERCRFEKSDAFACLEALEARSERFDVVCVDPPAFARSRKDVNSALKGYRKLARLAAAVVAPGGFLYAASCSYNIETAAFVSEIAAGVSRAGRSGRFIAQGGASADHPVHPHLPETAYLKSVTMALD